MKKLHFLEVEGNTKGFYAFLGLFGLISLIGVLAAYYMEHNGHWVTGMSNQVIWGTPHVFAIFLIVAASGALNIASISSVFAKTSYKPLARLSGILAIDHTNPNETNSLSNADIVKSILDGKGRFMPAWKGILSQDDAEALVSYIRLLAH